jgi:hypothetical protein
MVLSKKGDNSSNNKVVSSIIIKKYIKNIFYLYKMDQICSLCNKSYSSKKGLLKHRRDIHEIYYVDKDRKRDKETNCYHCRYCKKEYKIAQSRWEHEKKCNKKDTPEDTIVSIPEPIKKEMDKMKEQIQKLQEKLLSSKRLDNKTFKALNKILIERSTINSHNNNNNNNTVNHNYQIVSIGNEDLLNVLTMQEKRQILNSKFNSLEKLVEITHC